MTPDPSIESVFALLADALAQPPDAREQFVKDETTDNPELQDEVLSLLRADEAHTLAAAFSDEHLQNQRRELNAIFEDGGPGAGEHASEPTFIGDYRIIRRIGQGGMGIVYEAEQRQPRRRVALKVVDGVRAGTEFAARLRAEAEIQGRLHHPGIAQIFEAGIATIGLSRCPFFAMELIEGRPILAFAEDADLDLTGRLSLLASVADAVGFAHERGVVHRDLKPENILVKTNSHPKVLDFGIARVTGDSTIAATTMTRDGQILGTLAYIAPEQFGSQGEVTSQADVYALGVIAFELLAGRPPIDLGGLSISAAIRMVDHSQPQTLRSLVPSIPRDVETIVATCLSREPERRYADGAAVASDLRRFLDDRPILARPPTRAYRAGKFVARNRALVGGTATTVLTLLVGVAVAVALALGEQQARHEAEAQTRHARESEFGAIRGLLDGADALAEAGRMWQAARQVQAVAPRSRGWEWRHRALSLPWVIRIDESASTNDEYPIHGPGAWSGPTFRRWIGPRTLAVTGDGLSRLFTWNVSTGTAQVASLASPAWRHIVPQRGMLEASQSGVPVLLEDRRTGMLDPTTGAFTPWKLRLPPESIRKNEGVLSVSHDARYFVWSSAATIEIFLADGTLVYSEHSGAPDSASMHWIRPQFDPTGRFIVLVRWSSAIIVDTQTWEKTAQRDFPGLQITTAISHDGSVLFVNSVSEGVHKFSLPDLTPLGRLGEHTGRTQWVVSSPLGEELLVTYPDEWLIRIFDVDSEAVIAEYPTGASHLSDAPEYSTDARLILVHSPHDHWPWLIDRQESDSAITRLEGHDSWIYQLAVSPDGSLLASAAPQGDIILWDVHANRLLARIPRYCSTSYSVTGVNMDAPLMFDTTGEHLYFQELDPESNRHGLTRLAIATGDRTWTPTGARDDTLDAVAALVPLGTPRSLYHHACVLADGRILQSYASPESGRRVIVRDTGVAAHAGTTDAGVWPIWTGAGRVFAGVAVHPEGHVFASGEYETVRIRNAKTLEPILQIKEGSSSTVYAVTYSPDGSRFAMATEDGRVYIFETEFYTRVAEIRLPHVDPDASRNYVFNLVWTPDGNRLITCGGRAIRVLESVRQLTRDDARSRWQADLDAARNARPASPAAKRVVAVERWAGQQIGAADAGAN